MKRQSRLWSGLTASIGILVLILDSRTALTGAAEGIRLCIRTVIPALFPFFVLTTLLTSSLQGVAMHILRPIGRLCAMPAGAEGLFLIGMLGGYPAGAQCITQAHRSGWLKKEDAHRMLGFCSNAGPAFLFGMAGQLFDKALYPWLLYAIQIVSALLVGYLLPGKRYSSTVPSSGSAMTLPQALKAAVSSMTGICGAIVIFRVLLAFCQRWFLWLFPDTVQAALTGLLELSNGVIALSALPSAPVRFVLCAALLSIGGLCVGMQTVSVVDDLGTGYYFPGKLLQGCISTLLAFLSSFILFEEAVLADILSWVLVCTAAAVAVYAVICWKNKNNSSNPARLGV